MMRPPPSPPLFPYTPRLRSEVAAEVTTEVTAAEVPAALLVHRLVVPGVEARVVTALEAGYDQAMDQQGGGGFGGRSEEHTSGLQSQSNFVCPLLLGKKMRPV